VKLERCSKMILPLAAVALGLGWVRPRLVHAPAPELRSLRDVSGREVPEGRYLDLARVRPVPDSTGYVPAPLPWQAEEPAPAAPPEPGRYRDLGALLHESHLRKEP